MTGLVAVAVLLAGTWGLGTALRLRFVHALPTTLLTIIFVLYLAYITGVLHVAWWVVVMSCVASGVAALLRLRRQDGSYRGLLPGAPLVAYLVAVALVMVFTRDRLVSAGDELRLWGAYPKLLFVDGGLQVGPDSLLMGEMQTYTPGLPIFGYFFAAFDTDFADHRVFLAYGVFAISLIAPLASRLSWQRPEWIVPTGVGMALLPLAYANNADGDFYASLFSDPVLGMVLGYLVWLAASGPATRMTCWQVGVATGVLYLVKTSGLVLAAVVLVFFVFRWLLATTNERWQHRLLGVAALAGPLSIAHLTWWGIQTRLGPASKFDPDQMDPALDLGLLGEFGLILLGFPEYSPGIGLFRDLTSFAILDVAMLIALACLVLDHRRPSRASAAWALGMLVVCQLIFLAGIYLLVAGPFEGMFLSYRRYSATMLTATSVVLSMLLAENGLPRRPRKGRVAAVILSACVVFLVLCFPLRTPVSYVDGSAARARADAQTLEVALAQLDRYEENPVVALVYRDQWLSHVGHHHGVYYGLLGTGARVDLRLVDARLQRKLPAYLQPPGVPEADFRRYLAEDGVRLLLIAQENPDLEPFARLFDRTPEVGSVYRVVVDGNDISLHWVA